MSRLTVRLRLRTPSEDLVDRLAGRLRGCVEPQTNAWRLAREDRVQLLDRPCPVASLSPDPLPLRERGDARKQYDDEEWPAADQLGALLQHRPGDDVLQHDGKACVEVRVCRFDRDAIPKVELTITLR